jgi:hypothetical protein
MSLPGLPTPEKKQRADEQKSIWSEKQKRE